MLSGHPCVNITTNMYVWKSAHVHLKFITSFCICLLIYVGSLFNTFIIIIVIIVLIAEVKDAEFYLKTELLHHAPQGIQELHLI